MSGRYLSDLANVLRAAGQIVVELDGWQGRARSSGGYSDGGPWCVMVHHTASGGDGASDANYCTFVDSARPLCNVVLGRDGTWYVCAAGATNTNGKGGPWTLANGRVVAADQMNLRAIGIEMSNNGVGMPYPRVQIDALFTGIIAFAGAYLGGRVDLLCQHVNWAPGRKIDPATGAAVDASCGWQPTTVNANGSWRLADLVAEAQRRAATPAPTPEPKEDPDVYQSIIIVAGGGSATPGAVAVADPAFRSKTFLTQQDADALVALGIPILNVDGATFDRIPGSQQWTEVQ